MRKRWVVRVIVAMSLMAVFLVARPNAAFAGYIHIRIFQNYQTGNCLDDNPWLGLRADTCDKSVEQQWGMTWDGTDAQGHNIYTYQNMFTGSCLDDSVYGLRAYYCHPEGDPSRIFQQFKRTQDARIQAPPWADILQNMATGSCVDDGPPRLRGYYCNGAWYQDWIWYDA